MSAAKKYKVGDRVLVAGTRQGLVEHVVLKVGRKWLTTRRIGAAWGESRYDMTTGQGEFRMSDGYITTAEAEDERREIHERSQALSSRGIRIEHRVAKQLGPDGLRLIATIADSHGIEVQS